MSTCGRKQQCFSRYFYPMPFSSFFYYSLANVWFIDHNHFGDDFSLCTSFKITIKKKYFKLNNGTAKLLFNGFWLCESFYCKMILQSACGHHRIMHWRHLDNKAQIWNSMCVVSLSLWENRRVYLHVRWIFQ